MIPLTVAAIAEAVGGRTSHLTGTEIVTGGVEFDSRKVRPGDLFVAVPGERVDGHDFAASAVAAGAVAVLAGREVDGPAIIAPPVPAGASGAYVLAGDQDGSGASVLAALGRLARHVVSGLDKLAVVGITGSSGKTSTKDLLAQLLEPMGETVAPPGSFNNELGHPWTVLRVTAETRHLVLELSARGPGHIAALCALAPPRIGVVINVGSAHLGEFGSREAVARTKGELVESLPADGVAVLNADDPLVAAMAERTRARVVTAGQARHADIRAEDIELDAAARPSFRLITPNGSADVRMGLFGAHHIGNALCAAAVAHELGAAPEEIAARLSSAESRSAHRMRVHTRADGLTVIDDAYNANPESMAAALKALAGMSRGRRAWAVLGPMAELGDDHVAEHDRIGRLAVRLDINRLIVVGEDARPTHQAACLEGSWADESTLVPDVDAAVTLLRDQVRPEDVVLVKASNGYRLWTVAERLLDEQGGGDR